jgi:hypothetical protein
MNQLNLFEQPKTALSKRPQSLVMSRESLTFWKQNIIDYQQGIKDESKLEQTSLFELKSDHVDSDLIDPFSLRLHPGEFYRFPEIGHQCCIYFVMDLVSNLLLYIGETKQTAKKRWANHDCKNYIMSYIELHRKYQMKVEIRTAFWYNTPQLRKHRLQLESELIKKWRSPFNKESWEYWGQPFGK